MKKIGIITLTGYKNYGNRLQNYALQEYLKKFNYEVNTIWHNHYAFKDKLKRIIKYILGIDKKSIIRENNIRKFSKKYISEFSISKNKVSILDNYYDLYTIGSDQIWNPDTDLNYLGFKIIDNKKPSLTYSASIGISNISGKQKELFLKVLKKNNLIGISVREENAKEELKKINKNLNIDVLIDPTMLFGIEFWSKICKKPKGIKDIKYVLCYFLGSLDDNRYESIYSFANKNGCKIINILDKNDKYYTSDPSEFLWLEKNAFLICTDSFHSSVFALLFNKPFVIFDRRQEGYENMSSRLSNLIKIFKLKNRNYNGKSITNKNLNHNYSEAYKILENERNKSNDYLKKVFKIYNDLWSDENYGRK
ncbi:MAG: polysaccharide pyruvyl transferase family protein [Bacilli bacterium]|nr:polysaccharide pyruvyl transferase family protein [Bacilli bacterium]